MTVAILGEPKLAGVHPHLVRVVYGTAERAPMPIIVLEGTRTIERQRQLVAKGASTTMRSRHIPAPAWPPDGFAHAVDLAPAVNGVASWAWDLYYPLAEAVKAAAAAAGVPIEWGGDWRTFKDGPHWQLPWASYPGTSVPDSEPEPVQTIPDENAEGKPTLRKGAFGPAVKTLQLMLNALGATPRLIVDGGFGPATKTAVIAFQRREGLAPDGIVGPKTWAAF